MKAKQYRERRIREHTEERREAQRVEGIRTRIRRHNAYARYLADHVEESPL